MPSAVGLVMISYERRFLVRLVVIWAVATVENYALDALVWSHRDEVTRLLALVGWKIVAYAPSVWSSAWLGVFTGVVMAGAVGWFLRRARLRRAAAVVEMGEAFR